MQNYDQKELTFSVANNAVTHLGRNLYSSAPPALAELVANSYDAYATNVIISIKENDNSLVIADNGKGLNFEEFESKYVTIGTKKQDEIPFKGMDKREPMGQKGIGKLSAFSLGEEYVVYSKTLDSKQWLSFELKYEDMIESGSKHTTTVSLLEKLPDELSEFQIFESGFIIHCKKLRKKLTKRTRDSVILQLSRRFYLTQDDFSIVYDDKIVSLETNFYYQNLEYVIYFGYSNDEINNIFKDNVIKKEKFQGDSNILCFIEDNGIKGWVGSVSKPKELKENTDNIIVYSNGKIADEDILKGKTEARIAKSYMVGEIQANYFIDLEDPITSSRQGLDDSVSEVKDFINTIENIRKYFIGKWDVFRTSVAVEKLPEKIQKNQSYQSWLNTLTPDQKKLNGKLLTLFSAKIDEPVEHDDSYYEEVNSMITAIASVINNIETDELIKIINGKL
ncbi:ATP-binding protein [Lactococcus carnosus]|uniref:ATP-binding protein n=3 Tax=Pseudolactococcus carnosus TaxID=2749961 RepID=UPI000812A4AE|nr:ATP-binding protein [Lactococcus carnosus]MCJ1980554.1 hypothetical protein [Lactococcus carnosus]MCJ1988522.1 hypothetical protein [Lactococcus carnosus]QDJ26273.1 hypothetical protein BHS00_06775 [Lactococcus carnosus]SCA91636.1 putative Molecular chaperone, HSP90 family (68.4 kDa protein in HgiDIIM 3'region) [Lactococcus piscium]